MPEDPTVPQSGTAAAVTAVAKATASVVNKFQDKVSAAAGVLYKPTGIRRIAKAEADAAMTALLGEQATERQRRAFQRMIAEEDRKQANIEAVAEKAAEQLADNGKPEQLSEDWLINFFDKASMVSDEQMQALWSRVLAGEANRPGTFTKVALQTLSVLEKIDAEMFVRVCRFTTSIGGPIVFNVNDSIYKDNGVDFSCLSHLDDMGLISFNNTTGFIRQQVPGEFQICYGETWLLVQMPEGNTNLPIGKILLTKVGRQLLPLSNAEVIDGFIPYAISQWAKKNITVTFV